MGTLGSFIIFGFGSQDKGPFALIVSDNVESTLMLQNTLGCGVYFPKIHKVGNVGRSGIFVFPFKFYFLVFILTYIL